MQHIDSTHRFSKTVEHYIKYRPGYPVELLAFMQTELGLRPEQVIADIGAGTGKLTRVLLAEGNPVIAVEPNGPMRDAAGQLLAGEKHLQLVDGTAETTKLADQSVDFITCAQAFHWFEPEVARREFRRILRPGGQVMLIWNKRIDEKSAFMQAYEDFLHIYATDYQKVSLRKIDHTKLRSFFNFRQKDFFHYQQFDFEGLLGRYLSCSYAMGPDHPQHAEAVRVLKDSYDRYADTEGVKMWYRTEVYYGEV